MPWRHLIVLILLAFHALLIVLSYFGLLPLIEGKLASDSLHWLSEAWMWMHVPALGIYGVVIEKLGVWFTLDANNLIFIACLATQDLFIGYVLGGFMDAPWATWFGKKEEKNSEEEELHRDLKIAARVMEREEQAEKDRLKEKVERLKREAKEKVRGGEADAAA